MNEAIETIRKMSLFLKSESDIFLSFLYQMTHPPLWRWLKSAFTNVCRDKIHQNRAQTFEENVQIYPKMLTILQALTH